MQFAADAAVYTCRFFDANMVELPSSEQLEGVSATAVMFPGSSYLITELRRFLEVLRSIQYVGPFRNAINEGAGSHFDMQIGTSFISQWNHWKSGPSRIQNRAIQRVTEDVRRLIGAQSLDISATPDGKSLHVVLDGRPHKLQELGAGFSQMALILANALVRKPSMIIIDEPELHLHPGLQTEFLTALAMYSKHGVMFATHSIGLARQAADHRFTVVKDAKGSTVRRYDRTPHLAEFLGSLGIAGLQELGWDKILLVEGVNDVRTAQALLRLFDKDRSVVVLPLGGDAMANGGRDDELSEVKRLAGADGRVFALVDSERPSADAEPTKARRAFTECCRALEIELCVTQRRAIENYISQTSLDEAFGHGRYVPSVPMTSRRRASVPRGMLGGPRIAFRRPILRIPTSASSLLRFSPRLAGLVATRDSYSERTMRLTLVKTLGNVLVGLQSGSSRYRILATELSLFGAARLTKVRRGNFQQMREIRPRSGATFTF